MVGVDKDKRQKSRGSIWSLLLYSILMFCSVVSFSFISMSFGSVIASALLVILGLLVLYSLFRFCRPHVKTYYSEEEVSSGLKKADSLFAKFGLFIAIPFSVGTFVYYFYTVIMGKVSYGDASPEIFSESLMLLLIPGIPIFLFWRMMLIERVLSERHPGFSIFRQEPRITPSYSGMRALVRILFEDFSHLKDPELNKVLRGIRIAGFSMIALLIMASITYFYVTGAVL